MVNMHSIFVIILCIIESVLNTDTAQYTGRHSSTYTPENIRICWIGDPVGSSSTQSHRASRFLHGHSDCTSHHIVLFIWSIIIRSVIRKNDYQRMVVLCKWLDMQSTIEIEFISSRGLIEFFININWQSLRKLDCPLTRAVYVYILPATWRSETNQTRRWQAQGHALVVRRA